MRRTGPPAEAEPPLGRAIPVLERALPDDHPHPMRGFESYAALLDLFKVRLLLFEQHLLPRETGR